MLERAASKANELNGSHARLLAGDALGVDADGRPVLVGSVCRSCGSRMFPVASVCFACMNEQLETEQMPREGTLYSHTLVHVGPAGWAKPFALGYVDLSNGVRVFSHLRGPLRIGEPVALAIAEIGRDADGASIETFVFQRKEA